VFLLFFFDVGTTAFKKAQGSVVVSNRIGMKFGRIVPQVTKYASIDGVGFSINFDVTL